jgi:hypothetical protein
MSQLPAPERPPGLPKRHANALTQPPLSAAAMPHAASQIRQSQENRTRRYVREHLAVALAVIHSP